MCLTCVGVVCACVAVTGLDLCSPSLPTLQRLHGLLDKEEAQCLGTDSLRYIELTAPILCFVHRLLVGAPRAVALPLQRANRTGGLYSCDITSRDPCTRIEFDNDGMFCAHSEHTGPAPRYPTCPFHEEGKGGPANAFLERGPLLIASALTVSCLP